MDLLFGILENLNAFSANEIAILLIIILVVAVIAWKLREGFEVGVVESQPRLINLADHLGGEPQEINRGPRFVAALSDSDTGTIMVNPYCSENEEEEELNKDACELGEAWEPLV